MDADGAIDALMWQNGGMCGLDLWNFVMHPVDAAMTCDPYGRYVRKWCPELADLPDDLIHKPWKCPASMLRRAGEEVIVLILKKRLVLNHATYTSHTHVLPLLRCGLWTWRNGGVIPCEM